MWESLEEWLLETSISSFMTSSIWAWPACEALHFMGLALLVGTVWTLDLRMLGVAKGLPLAPMHRLVRWGIAGFAINVVTGVLFFVGTPYQYIGNLGFTLKMIFLALAGLNVLVFYLLYSRDVEDLGPGQDAPFGAKVVAVSSLVFWLGVMVFGRLLPYLGDAF